MCLWVYGCVGVGVRCRWACQVCVCQVSGVGVCVRCVCTSSIVEIEARSRF